MNRVRWDAAMAMFVVYMAGLVLFMGLTIAGGALP